MSKIHAAKQVFMRGVGKLQGRLDIIGVNLERSVMKSLARLCENLELLFIVSAREPQRHQVR